MATVKLIEGDHTIEWSLNGYETLTAMIHISKTGALSCINVIVGTCQDKIKIYGNTITAILKAILEPPKDICVWITNKSSTGSITAYDIIEIVREYIQPRDLDFTVSTMDIMGLVAYYNGQTNSGNTLTGCEFT